MKITIEMVQIGDFDPNTCVTTGWIFKISLCKNSVQFNSRWTIQIDTGFHRRLQGMKEETNIGTEIDFQAWAIATDTT